MQKTLSERHKQWELSELLVKYPGLRLHPSKGLDVIVQGILEFSATQKGGEQIDDEYSLRIQIPDRYPRLLPSIWEVNKRIPPKFHKLDDGSLCLGSETRLRLMLLRSPSILSFVDMCVVPYLYGHSFFEEHGRMPFGELSHGKKGVIEDLAELFGVDERIVLGFVAVAAMKKNVANKRSCPCGSGLRLGSCHRKRVNTLRKQLGRRWFAYLMDQLVDKPVYGSNVRTSDMNAYFQRSSLDDNRFEFLPLTAEHLLGGTKR
ncbi:MAG: hypothetical protein DMG65_12290 [Candidatus Angelobacter sp. Gp1-AA117]|nr:MAG: hypothetical protein DMG65_12290 [Candidatus Angelobacter sp. Gp1-AA117]